MPRNEPDIATILEEPSVRDFALELLDELQKEAELESLFQRADEEMDLDLLRSHHYTDQDITYEQD